MGGVWPNPQTKGTNTERGHGWPVMGLQAMGREREREPGHSLDLSSYIHPSMGSHKHFRFSIQHCESSLLHVPRWIYVCFVTVHTLAHPLNCRGGVVVRLSTGPLRHVCFSLFQAKTHPLGIQVPSQKLMCSTLLCRVPGGSSRTF